MFVAYLRTFERMGLKAIPMKADTGPIGGDMSHEFIILADTGESEVFLRQVASGNADPGGGYGFLLGSEPDRRLLDNALCGDR